MTGPCQEYQVLLSAYASGDLEAPQSEQLRQHLAGCETCRNEAEQIAAVLDAARLPPSTEAELRVLRGLQSRVRASWGHSQRRRGLWRQAVVALSAAAVAAAVLLLLPGTLHRQGQPDDLVTVAAEWQPPDVDELWDTSAMIEVGQDQEMALLDEGSSYTSWEDEF